MSYSSKMKSGVVPALLLVIPLILAACTTTFIEFKGECVLQSWNLASLTMRRRMLCDFPPPSMMEAPLRERDAMDINPFPDAFDFNNEADTIDPNLLEKTMEYPPSVDDLEEK